MAASNCVGKTRAPIKTILAHSILVSGLAVALALPASAWGGQGKSESAKSGGDTAGSITLAMTLHGGISVDDAPDPLKQRIDDLTAAALACSETAQGFEAGVKKHSGPVARARRFALDSLNYVFEYRGQTQSSEAGDVILDEKHKLKSKASADYLRQRHADETQLEIVSHVLQLATALGMSDRPAGDAQAAEALSNLERMVGKPEAQKTVQLLSSYGQQVVVPESLYKKPTWSIADRNRKTKYVMERCLDTDQTIQSIKASLHKYNGHGQIYLATGKVVRTTLGLASMSPTLAAPVSQMALYFYTMATGGTEEDKLLKELYFDKRLDSRGILIREKTQLALENYQLARLTRNPVLLGCSESLVEQMTGPDGVNQVLGGTVMAGRRTRAADALKTATTRQPDGASATATQAYGPELRGLTATPRSLAGSSAGVAH